MLRILRLMIGIPALFINIISVRLDGSCSVEGESVSLDDRRCFTKKNGLTFVAKALS